MPAPIRYEPGYRFGRYTVIGPDNSRDIDGCIRWRVRCDCGTEKIVSGKHLRKTRHPNQSCGCWSVELSKKRLKHGHATRSAGCVRVSPEYRTYKGMISRCTNQKSPSFKLYGGRGITVCERWRDSFENFLADMGEKPSPAHSLDRVDNSGNYEPVNCRWATRKEQARNTRGNSLVEFRGRIVPIAVAAEMVGAKYQLVHERMMRGWTLEEALFRPVDAKKRNKKWR